MTGQTRQNPAVLSSLVLATLPYVTLLGCAGVVVEIALSFEEPHGATLLTSALLVAAAPIGMALHLALTSELTADEKHKWVTGLMTRRGPGLFAAYFNQAARRHATEEIAAQPGSPATGRPNDQDATIGLRRVEGAA